MTRSRVLTIAWLLAVATVLGVGTSEALGFIVLPSLRGAKVTGVWPGSPAHRIGLEVGDVVVAIDNQPVYTPADFNRLVGRNPQGVTLLLRDVRTGRYVETYAVPVAGKIGVSFQIIALPEYTLSDIWTRRLPLR